MVNGNLTCKKLVLAVSQGWDIFFWKTGQSSFGWKCPVDQGNSVLRYRAIAFVRPNTECLALLRPLCCSAWVLSESVCLSVCVSACVHVCVLMYGCISGRHHCRPNTTWPFFLSETHDSNWKNCTPGFVLGGSENLLSRV